MSYQDFFNLYNGKSGVGNTPENKGQCVGLVSLWMDTFGIPHVWGHAKDLYNNAPEEHFVKIPNTPEAIPQEGDIMVWSGGYNGTYGHTGIAHGKADINKFDCFEQNDPLGSNCHIKNYNYSYVIGWLRPKAQQEPMITMTLKEADAIRLRRDELYNETLKLKEDIKILQNNYQEQLKQTEDLKNELMKIQHELTMTIVDFDNYKTSHPDVPNITPGVPVDVLLRLKEINTIASKFYFFYRGTFSKLKELSK